MAGREWTAEEEEVVADLSLTARQAGERIGRSMQAVKSRRQYLRLHRNTGGDEFDDELPPPPQLSPDDDRPRGPTPPKPPPQKLVDRAEALLIREQARIIEKSAPAWPVFSGYWAEHAEQNTRAVLTIAQSHPKLLAAILKLEEGEAYLELGDWAIGQLLSAAVELRMIRADAFLPDMFGVTEVWERIEAEQERMAEEAGEFYATGAAATNGNGAGAGRDSLPGLMGELAP